jgi:hypothetical protein
MIRNAELFLASTKKLSLEKIQKHENTTYRETLLYDHMILI